MKYIPRPGIVFSTICGVHVLIPTRPVYHECKSMIRLPFIWAATFELLDKPDGKNRIFQLHRLISKKSDEEIVNSVENFCQKLYRDGYLVKVPDEENEETEEG